MSKKSRRESIYRIGSPSIRERNNLLRQATRYASIADAVAITLVKANGSQMQPNEWSIIIPKSDDVMAKPWDRLNVADGPNGELVAKVTIDPDMQAQIDAFQAELNRPVEAVGSDVVLPPAELADGD